MSMLRFVHIPVIALILFGVFYPQAPLYTDNQNTKFLHGAAQAGVGNLSSDWTANTLDPLPVFTEVVESVFRWLPEPTFHVIFAVLVLVYAWALVGIVRLTHPRGLDGSVAWIFAALFAFLHFTPLNAELLDGVAKQYILDHYLQPAVLGVMVLAGVRLILEKRYFLTSLCLALAVAFHPGAYLFTAGVMLAVMFWLALNDKMSFIRAAAPPAMFVAILAPLGIYQILAFAPASQETWQQAIDILSNHRIPHHTKVDSWLDASDAARLTVLVWVCWLVRNHRTIFSLMSVLTGFVLLSTVVLMIFPDAAATFSTPWRATAVLMPIAFAVILHRLSLLVADWADRRGATPVRVRAVSLTVIVAMVMIAVLQTTIWHIQYANERPAGVIRYASESAAEGQLYLVPPRRKEFNHFRLEAGVPILVNWKSHPYLDIEVIEWHARVLAADAFYRAREEADRNQAAQRLIDGYGVSHIVMFREHDISLPGLVQIYEDSHFAIYEYRDGERRERNMHTLPAD